MPQADGHPIAVALAAGVIDEAEAQRLQTAEEARRTVIDVDDFAKEELQLQDGKIR